jgi:hypothetical protein
VGFIIKLSGRTIQWSIYTTIVVVLLFFLNVVYADTYYVPDNYATIQLAIDHVVPGDSVIVRPGVYVENIDFKGKAITIKSETGPYATVIDGDSSGSVVKFTSNEGANSVLDGFTITNGTGTYIPPFYYGGGINCTHSAPTITNNIITGNSCYSGGGIMCYISPDAATITNNIIRGNSVETFGAGIYCTSAAPTIINNIITENSADNRGGGITCAYNSTATIVNNLIYDNTAGSGAGIYCLINGSALIVNNTISKNTGTNYGGGICCYNSSPTAVNNIIWNNKALLGPEISITNSTLFISYSDVKGGQDSVYVESGTLNWGDSMIDTDPLYVDTLNYDFHLTEHSPCINVGNTDTTGLCLPSCDLDGNPRIYDETIDMGSYECQVTGIDDWGLSKKGNILYQNYPNPFRSVSTIRFKLNYADHVTLKMYNILGQEVITLIDGELQSGKHRVIVDASALPVGIYYYYLQTNIFAQTRRCVVLK